MSIDTVGTSPTFSLNYYHLMLRLAAVRSTQRYVPTSVQWGRFKSTVQVPAASTSGGSSDVRVYKGPSRRTKLKAAGKRKVVASEPVPKSYKELGLKYDPVTLPLRQVLDPNIKEFTEEEYAMTLIHGRSVHDAFHHPRTHDIPVANIHFRSHHLQLLKLFAHFATHAASSLGIPASKVVSLPTQRRLWTVLRSPFAHKKSQENFERRVHKRAIKAWDADAEVVQRWIEYLRTHAMPGVGMKVTTWQRMPLQIGASALAHEKDATERPSLSVPKQIEQLATKIIQEERANSAAASA